VTVFERVVAQALFDDVYGGSSGMDQMLESICLANARIALHALATSPEVRRELSLVISEALFNYSLDSDAVAGDVLVAFGREA
jgi:hypothetical protein